ncbi:hypothetical protein FQN54_005379 [Arachnomyces sp. PD_36]|nr:hypothetical protein FQN54_005379 [Arachnomyces sp. PD_36]
MLPQVGELQSSSDGQHVASRPEDYVLTFVDRALDTITRELMYPGGRPSISLKRRSSQAIHFLNPQTGAVESPASSIISTYSWPGKTPQEAWYFGTSITRIQVASNRKKWLTYWSMTLHTPLELTEVLFMWQPQQKDCLQGIIIPRVEDVQQVSLPEVKWVLVVEKEAVFRRLASKCYHKASSAGKGILITGKGYPDLSTRALLRMLSDSRLLNQSSNSSTLPPIPPIFALVDSDPDGVAIMSIYKYGSVAQAHENAKLNVRQLQWLGLRTSSVVTSSDGLGGETFLPLSPRDRKKAVAMLSSPCFTADGPEPTWRAELQQMLLLNLKAEIEILYEKSGGLEGWLDERLRELT